MIFTIIGLTTRVNVSKQNYSALKGLNTLDISFLIVNVVGSHLFKTNH